MPDLLMDIPGLLVRGNFKKEKIYYVVKGEQYVRSYAVPFNPRTPGQQARRAIFADAVSVWKNMTEEEKEVWNHRVKVRSLKMLGRNLYISFRLKT